VIPNETEAEALGGVPVRSLEDARACVLRLLDGGLPRVIVTLGANGALCAGDDGVRHVPAFQVTSSGTPKTLCSLFSIDRRLPKLDVAGSSPVSLSIFSNDLRTGVVESVLRLCSVYNQRDARIYGEPPSLRMECVWQKSLRGIESRRGAPQAPASPHLVCESA